ncbi:MAG: Protein translocase membrane subunit SecG, partial [uncultured Quadrisphaera sp.]
DGSAHLPPGPAGPHRTVPDAADPAPQGPGRRDVGHVRGRDVLEHGELRRGRAQPQRGDRGRRRAVDRRGRAARRDRALRPQRL